jgi:hypothetical protein
MLNKLIGERDWSAQEVSHNLLQLPVQESSQSVVTLDCRPERAQDNLIVLEGGDVKMLMVYGVLLSLIGCSRGIGRHSRLGVGSFLGLSTIGQGIQQVWDLLSMGISVG